MAMVSVLGFVGISRTFFLQHSGLGTGVTVPPAAAHGSHTLVAGGARGERLCSLPVDVIVAIVVVVLQMTCVVLPQTPEAISMQYIW